MTKIVYQVFGSRYTAECSEEEFNALQQHNAFAHKLIVVERKNIAPTPPEAVKIQTKGNEVELVSLKEVFESKKK